MGRYDILTQIDNKPQLPTPPPVVEPAKQPLPSEASESSSPSNLQAGKPANTQTGKPVSMQTSKQVNLQTSLHANVQTGNVTFVEKYSTYMRPDYKKEIKLIALETDRKDYEVLEEAVAQYLTNRKKKG